MNARVYFWGHTGTGKSSLVDQFAARVNMPVVRVNFDGEISRMDLAQAHERMMENEAEGYKKGSYAPYRNPNEASLETRRMATVSDWQEHKGYLMNKIVERYKAWGFRTESYHHRW